MQTLLYSGFAVFLIKLIYDDYSKKIVDDKIIFAGTVYIFFIQILLDKFIFSVTGIITAAIVSFLFYYFGNHYFSLIPVDTEDKLQHKNIAIVPPFMPSLAIAVLIHSSIPQGLAQLLLHFAEFIDKNAILSLLVIIFSLIGLFFIHKNRDVYFLESEIENKNMVAFGDGDITAAIFLGAMFGYADFLAIFWMGKVIHSMIGFALLLKQKAKRRLST